MRDSVCAAVPADWFGQVERAAVVALIDASRWHPWRTEAALLLDAAEAARVQRQRISANRQMLTIAYAMHRLLLGMMLGCEPRKVALYRDGRGCPRVAGGLVQTSLSHADGLIAVAMAPVGPLGVDIERSGRAGEMPSVAERICHRLDAAALAGLDAEARNQALLALWVRKEAALKAAGVGLALEMDAFAAPCGGVIQVPPWPPAAQQDPVRVRVRMLDAGQDCVAAIAAPQGTGIECRWLHPPRPID